MMVQKRAKGPPRQPTKKEKQDDSIMNTNNSCIVSKRSVEKLYHGEDHGFLRYFVKKFQRRSPLINRGYWLRMRAIESIVRMFLQQNPSKPKVVVNLGCGYDPLPFNLLSKGPLCQRVKFFDVDYPQLMRQKVKIIQDTPQLSSVLCNGDDKIVEGNPVILRSDSYLAVACDLEDFATLDRLLRQDSQEECDYLFVAEVSITYMEENAAEAVLQGAAKFESSQFCLLEQFLPDGIEHPFAKTMLGHFEKLNSHLRSVTRFPSLSEQKERFLGNGWPLVNAESLWTLWSDPSFVRPEERRRLDCLEPFDEWEEFALFASHYFVLIACNTSQKTALHGLLTRDSTCNVTESEASSALHLTSQAMVGTIRRRSATSAKPSNDQVLLHGGQGPQGRLHSAERFLEKDSGPLALHTPETAVECHTVTKLAENRILVVGGRSSPDAASSKCYLIDAHGSHQIAPLPKPLYRHCTVRLDNDKVLVHGGKQNGSDVSSSWLLWVSGTGWTQVSHIEGDAPPPLFGACMAVTTPNSVNSVIEGVLFGGLDANGRIVTKAWVWRFDPVRTRIACTQLAEVQSSNLAASDAFRFGACLTSHGENGFLLSGGIGRGGTVTEDHELLVIDSELENITPVRVDWHGPRPMLVGSCVENLGPQHILVVGGGATCFSFGTNWNTVGRILSTSGAPTAHWRLAEAVSVRKAVESNDISTNGNQSKPGRARESRSRRTGSNAKTSCRSARKSVDHIKLAEPEDFERVMEASRPVLLDDLDLGPCTTKWTIDYLRSQSPPELTVTVHDSPTPDMSFLSKNFAYKSVPFTSFLDAISSPIAPAHMYLRSVSRSAPTTTPTLLAADFPFLAPDFHLPAVLASASRATHSSPLRIAGPVAMWLHYDVMANIYCQIRGRRRMLLYPPAAVAHLDFPHGSSSARKTPFAARGGEAPPPHIECFEARLEPGDVLFIPPFWAHAAEPVDGVSVAVNVFFRSLGGAGAGEDGAAAQQQQQHVYAAGRDTYANRDLAAYEHGRKAVQRVVAGFKGLPRDARVFYLERLSRELKEAARKNEP